MGIISPGSGLFLVRSFFDQTGNPSFSLDLGAGPYRAGCYIQCTAAPAGTRKIQPAITHSYRGNLGIVGAELTLSMVGINMNETHVFNHDGSPAVIFSVIQTLVGAGDAFDITWVIEKLFEDFES